jgi:hypothetical protein
MNFFLPKPLVVIFFRVPYGYYITRNPRAHTKGLFSSESLMDIIFTRNLRAHTKGLFSSSPLWILYLQETLGLIQRPINSTWARPFPRQTPLPPIKTASRRTSISGCIPYGCRCSFHKCIDRSFQNERYSVRSAVISSPKMKIVQSAIPECAAEHQSIIYPECVCKIQCNLTILFLLSLGKWQLESLSVQLRRN